MAGVSIVGLSGSMIKDVVKEQLAGLLREFQAPLGTLAADLPPPEPIEEPAVTKVLIGAYQAGSCMFCECPQADRRTAGVFFILFAQVL